MQIKLWGVRGSIAAPMTNTEYRQKLKSVLEKAVKSGLGSVEEISGFVEGLQDNLKNIYGGNTTCASVKTGGGELIIIDCGTGLRNLGNELMRGPCGRGKGKVHILLTHNHWDHIQGLPFFKPLYVPGNEIHFYSPYKGQEEILKKQMMAPNFPAPFEKTGSTKFCHYMDSSTAGPHAVDDVSVDIHPLTHPNGSFAYRFKEKGKTFIFATDAEFTGETLERTGNHTDFFLNADLLVLDSQYTLEESFMKIDWGHTSNTMAVNCGLRWKVKTLVLTHHEPDYLDERLHENYETAIQHSHASGNSDMKILLATEGMTFDL
jgi:phosphoribosyl 1,2-cyclic phosphodiesterase